MTAKFTYADLTDADLDVFGNVSDDEDLGNKSDDEWRPKKGVTASAEEMDDMTGYANLGLGYVQKFNPKLSKPGVEWVDSVVNKAYPPDQVFSAPTGDSIIEDVAHLKGQYNPSNEELTQKQNMQIINAGLEVLREQTPREQTPRELPVKVSARPLSNVSYMKPPRPPKYTRGGASRKMRKSKKTKKSRKMRRVKTQMRRKNSSRKSTRRRTRK